MSVRVPAEVIEELERLGATCNGDVLSLIAAARERAPAPFADDAVLANALEQAATQRAAASDRGAAWWLACAIATLRASPVASAQEEAEVVAARVLGELSRSPAALGPLPASARWIVAGAAEPPPVAATIELARKNATTYVERLDAELGGRAPTLRAKWESAPIDATRAAIEEALASYAVAAAATRAALSRVIDHVVGRTSDPELARAGAVALAELDDVVLPALRARVDNTRSSTFGVSHAPAPPPPERIDRPSFAGAAPPSFQRSAAPTPEPPPEPAPPPPDRPATIEELDAAMRAAYERAWVQPTPENRAAFERAVRARYERETESIADPEARRQALDHYVAHALAQLPA